jgi:hypothetical protein
VGLEHSKGTIAALCVAAERRPQWRRVCDLLLAEADVDAFSKQVEVALIIDAKLDVTKL